MEELKRILVDYFPKFLPNTLDLDKQKENQNTLMNLYDVYRNWFIAFDNGYVTSGRNETVFKKENKVRLLFSSIAFYFNNTFI